MTAWEAELTTRYLDDGEEVAAATRHGDAYTRRVRALHCDECGKEADRERGDSLQAWNEDIGPREWPDRSVILTSPCCPECGSKEVDVTAWENRLVTRHVDGDEEVAAPDIQGDAYTEGVVRVRCVDCSLVADAEKGDDVGVWQEVTLRDIRRVTGPGWCLSTFENCAPPENDRWTSWEAALEAGRSYMVGDRVPIDEFVQRHRSPMLRWQQVAYRWAVQHPDRMLIAENDTNCWQVYRRGEYVELGLPHHDAGGVRYYISRNGRSKVRVNQD